MRKKIIAVLCSLSLWFCTPGFAIADGCNNHDTAEFCMHERDNAGESGEASLLTKILIGVLIYAIVATLLWQQGSSGNDFAEESGL